MLVILQFEKITVPSQKELLIRWKMEIHPLFQNMF